MLETKTLEEVLRELHYGGLNQDVRLSEILGVHLVGLPEIDGLIDKFPTFIFGDDIELKFRILFLQRYDIRRIGQETIDLFMHYWREKCNELLIKYAPKMQKWLDNFNDLFKFTVKLERDDTTTTNANNQNTYYLNPASANPQNLKVQDVDTSANTGGGTLHSERDVLQSVWGKTRADIMEKILNLKDIFNDCLDEFEVIFSGVL